MPCRRSAAVRLAGSTAALAAVLLAAPVASRADERPKWELGIGSVFYTQPDYVGSDEYRFRPIPFPWIIYRGSRLRLDRESIQTRIFGTHLVRLDLSAGGQIPVDSDDNDRRHGMPDLDWVAQVGPSLKFEVAESDDGRHGLDVDVPLRAAFAVDFDHFSYEGLVASPKLVYRYEPEGWRFEGNAGLEFGNNDYNEFLYSVAPRHATPERPAYGADGGYAGIRLSAGVSRYFGPFYAGLFTRYFNLEGATFGDSPLVGSRHAFFGGIAIGWIWMKSDEMVPVGAEAHRLRRDAVRRALDGHPSPAAGERERDAAGDAREAAGAEGPVGDSSNAIGSDGDAAPDDAARADEAK